jgi:hypothetical protein
MLLSIWLTNAKDRQKTLQAVDASMQAYVGVLKSAGRVKTRRTTTNTSGCGTN